MTYARKPGFIDIENTKEDGKAAVQCFAANDCLVEASKWLTKLDENSRRRAVSLPKRVEAGDESISITVILSEKRRE